MWFCFNIWYTNIHHLAQVGSIKTFDLLHLSSGWHSQTLSPQVRNLKLALIVKLTTLTFLYPTWFKSISQLHSFLRLSHMFKFLLYLLIWTANCEYMFHDQLCLCHGYIAPIVSRYTDLARRDSPSNVQAVGTDPNLHPSAPKDRTPVQCSSHLNPKGGMTMTCNTGGVQPDFIVGGPGVAYWVSLWLNYFLKTAYKVRIETGISTDKYFIE